MIAYSTSCVALHGFAIVIPCTVNDGKTSKRRNWFGKKVFQHFLNIIRAKYSWIHIFSLCRFPNVEPTAHCLTTFVSFAGVLEDNVVLKPCTVVFVTQAFVIFVS